jgi:hypothetical protein
MAAAASRSPLNVVLPTPSIIKSAPRPLVIRLTSATKSCSASLQLHEMVVWTPDRMKGEVIVKDGSGVKIRWEDSRFGYYQFTDLLSQIERLS